MSLEVQRQETSQVIADTLQKTFFRRYYRAIGTFLGRGKTTPIWVTMAVIMLVNLLVGEGISWLLGETQFTTPKAILTNLMCVGYTYFTIPLIFVTNTRLVEFLRTRLLVSMQEEKQILAFQKWANQWFNRTGPQVFFSLGFGLLFALWGFYSIYQTWYLSAGIVFIYFVNFFHLAPAIYSLIAVIALLLKLRHWDLALFPDDPASSPILLQLSTQVRDYTLLYSSLVALFMFLTGVAGGLNLVSIASFMVANWIPVIILFIVGNSTFSQLIIQVKQERLEKLQSKIMELSSLDDLDKEKTARIMGLMDYYDSLHIKGYRIHNVIAISMRDVTKTSDAIAVAFQAGANQVVNVEFYTSELRKYRDQAREMAMKAASEKASALAQAAGSTTDCALNISENSWSYFNGWNWWSGGNSQNLWTQNAVQNAAPASSGSGVPSSDDSPVSAGQISVRAEVSVTFALK